MAEEIVNVRVDEAEVVVPAAAGQQQRAAMRLTMCCGSGPSCQSTISVRWFLSGWFFFCAVDPVLGACFVHLLLSWWLLLGSGCAAMMVVLVQLTRSCILLCTWLLLRAADFCLVQMYFAVLELSICLFEQMLSCLILFNLSICLFPMIWSLIWAYVSSQWCKIN